MATTTVPLRSRFSLRLPDSVSALADRDFRVVWVGSAVSLCGTWMQVIAQGLLVLKLWDSAFAVGTINFAGTLPTLALMLFGGVLADQGDKRRILIVTQAVMAALAVLVGILVVTGDMHFWMLVCIAAMLGVVIGYDMPAYQAFLPELVKPEKIGQVVALNSSTFHGSRMVGPAFAAVLIPAFGLAIVYFVNAASFVAVILSLLIVSYRPAKRGDGPRESAIEGLRAGLRHARARPNVRALLLLTGLNTALLFPCLAVLMPFYVKDVLEAGDGVLGWMMASSGVGSVLGALVLIWWGQHGRASRIWFGALAAPLAMAVLAVTREPAVAIAASAALSLAFSLQLGLVTMILQESTPNEFRGRVMSLHGLMFNGMIPFAGLATSVLVVALGLPAVMVLTGAAFAVGAFFVLRFAAGGIDEVVRASHMEYQAVAAGGG